MKKTPKQKQSIFHEVTDYIVHIDKIHTHSTQR